VKVASALSVLAVAAASPERVQIPTPAELCPENQCNTPFSFLEVSSSEGASDPGIMEGVIDVGGQKYRATCNCNGQGTAFENKGPYCQPAAVKIRQDHPGSGLSPSEIRETYAQPLDISFGRISEIPFSCLDDRIMSSSLSTPGGDLGEFLLGLSVLESVSPDNKKLDQDTVNDLLVRYLGTIPANRKFYHCTDDAAVSHMEKQLAVEGLDLTAPAEQMRKNVLSILSDPSNVGDSHIRLMLKNPKWYFVGDHLTPMVLKAFYSVMWDKSNPFREKLKLDVLVGSPNPKAFIEVTTSTECEQAGMAPLLKPKIGDTSAVISQMTAVGARRRELAAFLASQKGAPSADVILKTMNRHGWTWLDTTGSRIAKDLAFYRLSFV